ncbi:MAG: ATP-dependent zinc metalloprotease FtsH [Actinomycetota bacterium]|nr:ATP-dependent zinc metalloprotease FtsH [Actinomycetota bacterium]
MSKRGHKRRFFSRAVFWVGLCIPALVLLYVALLSFTVPKSPGREISLLQFTKLTGASGVQSATFESEDSRLEFARQGQRYWVALPSRSFLLNQFFDDTTTRGIPVRVDQQKFKQLIQPALLLVPALIIVSAFVLFFLLMRSSASSPFLKAAARRGGAERPTTFADLAGVDEAVVEAQEIRDYLRDPRKFNAVGATAPRGILFVGPPGTGKTLLARAVAGEAGVPFFSMSGADFVEMYVGVGAARVRDLFRQVRERAPAILFIDELDAMGRSRVSSGTVGQDERDQTLNQLLVELDGFDQDTGVVLIGATNRPDVLDPALLRRGRFDRQITIDRPDRLGRLAILEVHARDKTIDPSVDLGLLASDTPGFTGADLAVVLNEAALLTVRQGRRSISQVDLEEAVDRIVSGSGGRTQLLSAEEKRATACHEAGHTLVALALPAVGPVRRVSIMGRGRSLGSTHLIPADDRVVWSRSQLEERVAYMMGGRAADELVLGQPTSSSKDDLRRATDLARRMVCELGMTDRLGRRALGRPGTGQFLEDGKLDPDYSGDVASVIDLEISRLVEEGFAWSTSLITENRALFEELAHLLIRNETLREDQLTTFAHRLAAPHRETPQPPEWTATRAVR